MRHSLYNPFLKRVIDVIAAALGMLFLSPLLIGLAALVCMTMGRPVLYTQHRIGIHGRSFTIRKFRTMANQCNREGSVLADERRMNNFGRALRACSLDELPSLWNVLRGEMSLVGPRPLLPEYLTLYSEEQTRRHEIKPGITGWAQIHGRNALSWEDKFQHDVWYVDHCSFWLDFQILLSTIAKVLQREGVSADDHATMPPFTVSTSQGGKRDRAA